MISLEFKLKVIREIAEADRRARSITPPQIKKKPKPRPKPKPRSKNCKRCGVPHNTLNEKCRTCLVRFRKRGIPIKIEHLCKGCLIPLDYFTVECENCRIRHFYRWKVWMSL